MQRSADAADGTGALVDTAFADPAFATAKAHDAVFAIVALHSAELVWANAAASAFWGSSDPHALALALFGPPDTAGRGWLGMLGRGLVPGRAPQLARLGPARGLGMRGTLVLGRSWVAADGRILTGFAVIETGGPAAAEDAWRRAGVPGAEAPSDEATALAMRSEGDGQAEEPQDADQTDDAGQPENAGRPENDVGVSLARRSQLAILRDRLNAAVDGAPTLRLLWRTDRDGVTTQIDDATFVRLGSPARFAARSLPEVLRGFDPKAAARVRDALATQLTWSGIEVGLPVAEAAAAVPMVLSASPVFGPDRGFAGFRGFGTIDLGRLDVAAPRPVAMLAQMPPAADEVRPEPGPEQVEVAGSDRSETSRAADEVAAPLLEPADGERPAPAEAAPPHRSDAGDLEPPLPEADMPSRSAGADMPSRSAGADMPSSSGRADLPQSPDGADQPSTSANVVPLRRTPAVPVRSGAGVSDHEPSVGLEAEPPELAAVERDEAAPASSDELAFLALGDALRAQIDVAPQPEPGSAAETDASEAAVGEVTAPASDAAARLLDQMPTALVVVAGDRPVFANRAAARLLGYAAPADLLRAGPGLVPADAGISPANGEASEQRTATLRTAGGEPLAVLASGATIDWVDAKATLWTLEPRSVPLRLASDATEQRLDDAEGSTGDLLDRVDDAVVLLDAGGRIRRMNRRGENWFARPGAASVLGQSITEILAPDSRGIALALMGDVKAQKDGLAPLRRDVMVRTADHLPLAMVLTMGRVGASGFYATLRDVSALKRIDARVVAPRDAGREAGQLPDVLARVSHEIRTPLNAILGFAEIIMDERFGPLGNPRYKDYLKDIHASGTQVMSLVSDLLDLSRIQAGQIELDVGSVDVNKIVSEAVAQMQPEAHRERVIMRTSLGPRIPSALVDERSARQIVQNLLSNAVKFNEPGGQVIVSTAQGDAGTVVLRVRDTGIGMSDAEIAAALEPFQRATAPGVAVGNGLGLPLTRALIGANGASMAIRSRPREGTLVEVAFASAAPEEARRPA